MNKRPLLFGVMAFVIGELAGLNRYMTMGLGMVVVFLPCYIRWDRRRKQQTMPFFVMVLGIAFLLGILNGSRCMLSDSFLDYLDATDEDTVSCDIQGRVIRLEYRENQRVLFIQTEEIREETFVNTGSYIVKVYENSEQEWEEHKNSIEDMAEDSMGKISVGNRVLCKAEMRILRAPDNPGEFNSKQYYQARGIDFLAYAENIKVVEDTVYPIRQKLTELQRKGQNIFRQCLSEKNAGLMSAMLLGNSGELDSQLRKQFQRNGIAHILAISALHISIIGSTLYKMLRKIGATYWNAGLFVILLLLMYGWMTGFSGSTIRAVIMFVLALVGDILGRTYDMLTAIGVSCLCILVENPYRLFDAGFLLSFGAVISLGVIVPIFQELIEPMKKGRIRWYLANSLLAGIVLQVTTGPIIIYFYYDYPIYSVLLNLMVVPLMTPVVILGFIGLFTYSIFPLLAEVVFVPCEWILNLFTVLCSGAEQLPGAIWHVGAISLWEIVFYYGVLFVIGLCIKHRQLIKGMTLMFLYILVLIGCTDRKLKITILDVGQGDCILMETPEKQHILIDGGSSSRSRIGEYIITPAVKYYGSDCLDYVFISHVDQDHVNGIEELMELMNEGGIQIRRLVVPELALYDEQFQELILKAQEAGIQVCYFACGKQLNTGTVEITCLHPNEIGVSENNTSMVLSVTYESFDMLFTGDLETAGEKQMLMEYGESMPAYYDVLKVGHHGSSGSTSEEFLNRISPVCSVISCGKNNSYGHPHEETLERLEEEGVKVLRTDEVGAIMIQVDGEYAKIAGFVGR